jgi:hypothetical protein
MIADLKENIKPHPNPPLKGGEGKNMFKKLTSLEFFIIKSGPSG